MRKVVAIRLALLGFVMLVCCPQFARAQASISGVVKDSSGAVLPGVTVEAASPALIEKVRSVISDGNGGYNIVDLRPGTYSVSFTLAGFNAFKREGIVLQGTFNANVNAVLMVGALEETITVTGETPIVDIRTTEREQVITHQVIDDVPNARTHVALAALLPGVSSSGGNQGGVSQDVGGSLGDVMATLVAHGSKTSDTRLNLDGFATNNDFSGTNSSFIPNFSGAQEVTVDVSSASAETATGGVRVNVIPKDGGNMLHGTLFGTGWNSSFQSSNFTQALKSAGLGTPNSTDNGYNLNAGAGGPIVRDKIWFYVTGYKQNLVNYVGGMFDDLNAGNPNAFTYAPNLNHPSVYEQWHADESAKVTWQADPKNKFSVLYDSQNLCQCPRFSATTTREAGSDYLTPIVRQTALTYTSPVTSRLLIEAGISQRAEVWEQTHLPAETQPYGFRYLPGIVEQSTGLTYRNKTGASTNHDYSLWNLRGSMSYVTGRHAAKVGFTDQMSRTDVFNGNSDLGTVNNPPDLSYRFNAGAPNQLTEYARPVEYVTNVPHDLGIFAQDKYSVGRSTINAGLRFDFFSTSFPAQTAGPTPYTPNRNLSFPATPFVNWKDWEPRLGYALDLFGDGKTALKASLNKYVVQATSAGTFGDSGNPVNLLATQVTRSWSDKNGNFFPDCNLTVLAANGECGAVSDSNFGGTTASTAYDPNVTNGWGKRQYDWEFSTGVQRQLLPRLAMDVEYFRRWYGNQTFTNNLAVQGSDYTSFTINAPSNPLLPGGGSYPVTAFDLNPNKVGQVNNLLTFTDNYGGMTEHFNGVDLTLDSRLQAGILLRGGVSVGRDTVNVCGLAAQVPAVMNGLSFTPGNITAGNSGWMPLQNCNMSSGFITQVKIIAAYTVPKVAVQTSATVQSIPGPAIAANYVATNAVVSPALGRSLSANAANTTIDLVPPGALYGQRLNQLDLRFSKRFTLAQTKIAANFDMYNLLNVNTILTQNNSYAVWQTPQAIELPRLFRISLQLDF